jgi:peptidoglycan/xylan/chitin deacetylase (PgdA/CDA1 family)
MDFLADRRTLSRPGLVITFDDGLRDNGEVAAPLLDRFGLVGWFLVPGAFLDSTPETQREYCLTHIRGDARFEQAGDDPACAMTWEVVRALAARGHAIGCHTWTHRTLGRGTPASVIEAEVVAAQHRLADRVGRSIETFCWVRGRVCDYSADAHAAVARAYALAFMTMGSPLRRGTNPLALHRFNVEASWPLSLVRFQTSRFMEAWFLRRRHAVEREIRRAELRPGTSGGLRS